MLRAYQSDNFKEFFAVAWEWVMDGRSDVIKKKQPELYDIIKKICFIDNTKYV